MVNSLSELQRLVASGFDDWSVLGDIHAREKDGLILLNYTAQAQYSGRWNWIERTARGIILDRKTGDIVALPFPKFFNWLEGGRCTSAHLVEATEKVDGSLGIMYPAKDGFRIATRGSFDGDQALWATDFLRRSHQHLCERWRPDVTLIFEIVYPDNKIVVDYGEREDLVLLGARNVKSGEDHLWFPYLTQAAAEFGLSTPKFYSFNSWKSAMDARDTLTRDEEGFVLRFADGRRFKFKGHAYLEAHRIISHLSFNRVLDAMRDGKFQEMLSSVPEEYHGDILDYSAEILQVIARVEEDVFLAFRSAPKGDRKEFALWVNKHHRTLAPYLFAKMDGKPLEPLIFKKEFSCKI
jgi:RNA ligase